jgi:hypothetical protein
VLDAQYNATSAAEPCHAGTRLPIIDDILRWTESSDPHAIFVLSGPMGYGKTAIAQSVCQELAKCSPRRLGASFFVSATHSSSRDPYALVRTIAFQLALRLPHMRNRICANLHQEPSPAIGSLEDHIKRFISFPLKGEVSPPAPIVIVLDGIDECGRIRGEPRTILYEKLSRAILDADLSIKLFISGFSQPPALAAGCRGFNLSSVPLTSVHCDIDLCLRDRFKVIHGTHRDIPMDWPHSSHISLLAGRSEYLFLFASTVLRFVSHRLHNPVKRLQEIVDGTEKAAPTEVMDVLYLQILHAGVEDAEKRDRAEVCEKLRRIVGSVVLGQQPLTLRTLASLLDYSFHEISEMLESVDALVFVPRDDPDSSPVRPFHTSFGAFLTNRRRCESDEFYVDPIEGHAFLAERCFTLMEQGLRRNMAGIDRNSRANPSTQPADLEATFPSDLQYACRYWAFHAFEAALREPMILNKFIHRFSFDDGEPLAHWVEACSLLRQVQYAKGVLAKLDKWCLVGVL